MATLIDRIKKLEDRRAFVASRPPVIATARAARVAHMLDTAAHPGCTDQRYLRVADLIHTARTRANAEYA